MTRQNRQFLIAFALVVAPAWAAVFGQEPSPVGSRQSSVSANDRQVLVTFSQQASRRLRRAGSTPRAYGGRTTYKTSPRVKRVAARLAKTYGLRRVDEWPIQALGVHCVVYELPRDLPSRDLLELLARDPRVESAQEMQIFRVLARGYNDPYLDLQHGIRSMQIERAHLWARGRGVKVAVIDTGVDVNHPELQDRIETAKNFVDENPQAFTSDVHGTAVVGVIAAAADNGIGIVGVAPAVEILALKACWQEQTGSASAICNSFTLAKAISFAISRDPDVLNLSLAGPPDPLLSRLLSRAIDRGIVVISAADPDLGRRPGFPSAVDRVITVSAAGTGDPRASSSVAAVHALIAPGKEIFTTTPHGTYGFLSGSSLAAAHVSGLAALLLERAKGLSADRILALLRGTGSNGLNACAALTRLLHSGTCPAAAVTSSGG
ncbi:MAG: S8 family serine peptidase [Acidobacteria bacterium]|nr:S8 family serine peptidase [Acidobacteriota bacterium]